MTDHSWPTDPNAHVWGSWRTNTGLPKPTQTRSCVHPDCRVFETREAPRA